MLAMTFLNTFNLFCFSLQSSALSLGQVNTLPKWFGTDGVRGVANLDLSPELAFKLGEAGALFLAKKTRKLVVGRDTRASGDLLESAIVSGICAAGCDALHLGVVPTPAVAYLTRKLKADGGVVISASHNPAEYNGIKFFDASGIKLSADQEEQVEELIERVRNRSLHAGINVGRLIDVSSSADSYINHVVNTIYGDLEGLKVALDCANGAAYRVAPEIIRELGAEVISFSVDPDGTNINLKCGSTHPDFLQEIVQTHEVDVGLAFDGDADRVVAVDERGNLVDGDFIMAICSLHLKELGLLQPNALVTTVMTNVGFDRCMESHGIKVIKTPVGDRYVLQEMLDDRIMVGGEQSGHVIFLNHNSTGDGIITALQLLAVIRDKGQPLSELAKVMTRFPQVLRNIKVDGDKELLLEMSAVKETIKRCETELGEKGRILVRPSGTEPLVRVMVEAEDAKRADSLADEICQVIERQISSPEK